MSTERKTPKSIVQRFGLVPIILVGGGALVLILGGLLLHHAMAGVNDVALTSRPKAVTVMQVRSTTYRPMRRYVGTIEPWVSANIGPQLVSAYVETVLVRPGDRVKRGQVLATLDCRNTNALQKQIRMQARALAQTQAALESEAKRVTSLVDGGFVSENEVEQKSAESASKQAQVLALQAQLLGTDLQVADCILRAPFDGDIGDRLVDPGAFLKPGAAVATVVDRTTLRVTASVPESDFSAVSPQTPVTLRVLATGQLLGATITRRAPQADENTRTIHLEIDVPNRERLIPSGTTADISLEVGAPEPALEIPLTAASVREDKATIFEVKDGVARKAVAKLLGERQGRLYLDPALGQDVMVVTEGRSSLEEGEKVEAKVERLAPGETSLPVVSGNR
ncbi:MAG TPA: efflux RND transporter periplasmic adaptor subunit [Myxococcales bacterium]|nr:efflux RND transporter periplasmic adaptor subunit [Myxococcales bacterium]